MTRCAQCPRQLLPAWGQRAAQGNSADAEPVYFDVQLRPRGSGAQASAAHIDLLRLAATQLSARLGSGVDDGAGARVSGFFSEEAAAGGAALRVRLQLGSVQQLHALRDRFLGGASTNDEQLLEFLVGAPALEEMSAATGVELAWSVDATALVESYETAVLQLDKLTPHQQEQLRRLSLIHI